MFSSSNPCALPPSLSWWPGHRGGNRPQSPLSHTTACSAECDARCPRVGGDVLRGSSGEDDIAIYGIWHLHSRPMRPGKGGPLPGQRQLLESLGQGRVNYLRAWVRAAFCSCAASMVMVLSSSFLRGKDIIRSNSTPGDAAARESRQCYRASSDFFCGKPPHGSLHVGLATLFSANMKRLPLCTSSVV